MKQILEGIMRAALLVSILFCILPICWAPQAIAAEMRGTVTARKHGALQVSFATDGACCPQKGDRVDFSLLLQGIEVGAGSGYVAEIGEDFVWVDHLTGNADLNHRALVQATGQPTQTAPPARTPQAPRTLAETETGWGDGGYQQVSPDERHISAITAAHQS
jgi:hypothetical protein